MYSETVMYPKSGRADSTRERARYWGRAQGFLDRALLLLGAIGLVAVIPMLWIWALYGGGLGDRGVYVAAVGLSVLAAGLGFAMIRLLDGRR
jgi:hypothetical protein